MVWNYTHLVKKHSYCSNVDVGQESPFLNKNSDNIRWCIWILTCYQIIISLLHRDMGYFWQELKSTRYDVDPGSLSLEKTNDG